MSETIRIGLEKVQEAVEVRREITERYEQYKNLSEIVQFSALVKHADFKHAVDALYYLGGGWPKENSPGRMEKMLDDVVGMYRVLSLIGEGYLVESHLATKGITITLQNPIEDVPLSENEIQFLNKELDMSKFPFNRFEKLSDLVKACVKEAMGLQKFICTNADLIRDELKPAAIEALQVEKEEYDRIVFLTKNAEAPSKAVKKKNKIDRSLGNFKDIARTQL